MSAIGSSTMMLWGSGVQFGFKVEVPALGRTTSSPEVRILAQPRPNQRAANVPKP